MDVISDMLIRIKNAGRVGKTTVFVPYSKFKFEIANLLSREGYVASVNKKNKRGERVIDIGLLYKNGSPRVTDVRRISKPSRRMYARANIIRPVRQGYGMAVLSTPKGVLTGKDARKQKVGGEILFEIW